MFGNVNRSNGETTWANFNAKTGLFQIGPKANRKEFEALQDVFVRRVMITENQNFDDKTKMDKVIAISFRDAAGGNAVAKFSLGQFAIKVLGLLNAADLSKPISLVGGSFAEGTEDKDLATGDIKIREKAQPFLVGYQGDTKLQAKFSDDPQFKIPKVDLIEVKHPTTGKILDTVRDTTARDEFILAFAPEIHAKVLAATTQQPAPDPSKKPAPTPDRSDVPVEDGASLSPADIGQADGGADDEEAWRESAPTAA